MMSKTLKELLEARFVSSGAFRISPSGRKIRRRIKIGDDDYNKEDDIDKDGDVDKDDAKAAKRLRWESFSAFTEGTSSAKTTVNKASYSWGKMVTVHHGKDTSYPLHPEHQEAIKKLKDGEKTSFKDETNSTVHAHREGDNVHLTRPKTSSMKTIVAHSHFNEETINEYSMEDLHKDAAASLKKSIDKQSDDRIAALKNPPKKKGFFARVGEKQINMVKGAYHGLTKEETIIEHEEHGPDHVEIALDHRFPPKNQKTAMASLKAHGAEYVATSDKATHFKVHKDKAYKLSKELKANGVESDINEGLKHHIAAAAIAVAGALGGHAHAQSNDTQKTAEKPAATASVDSDKSPHDGGSKAEHQARIDKAVADGTMTRGDANVEKMKHGLRPSFGRVKMTQESKEEDPPFDKPYKTIKPSEKDKSGAVHGPMSRARHLARLAMKQVAKKAKA